MSKGNGPTDGIRLVDDETKEVVSFTPFDKLSKDLRAATQDLTRDEARYLVARYYHIQTDRQRLSNQTKALGKAEKPHEVIEHFKKQALQLEKSILLALDIYSNNSIMGQWARSIIGIGPVIAAGLDAWIDPANCRTAGDIYSLGGVNPEAIWLGRKKSETLIRGLLDKHGLKKPTEELVRFAAGEAGINPDRLMVRLGADATNKTKVVSMLSKRPWNADLKTLIWKIGESFKNFSGNPKSFYGRVYKERKWYEWQKNAKGDYIEQVMSKRDKSTNDADIRRPWWLGCYTTDYVLDAIVGGVDLRELKPNVEVGKGIPMLSPGHITERSKRYAAKLFLCHWHTVAWRKVLNKEPPAPYPEAILNHAHVMGPEMATTNQDQAKEAFERGIEKVQS